MANSFEEALADAQSDMVSIAKEYVAGRADEIYLYAVAEPGLTFFDVFYRIDGAIYARDRLNDAVHGAAVYDVSVERQRQMASIGVAAVKTLKSAAKEFGQPMPTEMRMQYSVASGSMTGNFRYDEIVPEGSDRWVTDIFREWETEVAETVPADSPTPPRPAGPSTWKEALSEAQRMMLQVSRDHVSGAADDILVYSLASTDRPFFEVFYRIGGRVFGRTELDDAVLDGVARQGVTYDVGDTRQRTLIETGLRAVGDLVDAAPRFGVPLPLEMRLEYSLADRQMTQSFRNRDLAADLAARSPEQIATAWRHDLKSLPPSA